MTQKAPDAPDFQTRLVERAMRDAAFRQQLISSPKAAIEQELGLTLPDNVDIGVVEETPAKIWLVLPSVEPPVETRELSDEELGAVAGGGMPGMATGTCGQAGFQRLGYITVTRSNPVTLNPYTV